MYATAHRVRSTLGHIGINSFLYLHDRQELPLTSSGEPDIDAVLVRAPGDCAVSRIEVPPGGNSVLSYLDVVAADGVRAVEVAAALDEVSRQLPASLPVQYSIKGIVVRFGAAIGLPPPYMAVEYEALSQRTKSLLRPPESNLKQRLVILVDEGAAERTYALEPSSLERIRMLRPEIRLSPIISIRNEVAADYLVSRGDIMPEIVALLTRLSDADVLALGGVLFQDRAGNVLAEWPTEVPFRPRFGQGAIYGVGTGRFLGWRASGNFYDITGNHVGYFEHNKLFSLAGELLGEAYPTHSSYYGVRSGGSRTRGRVVSQLPRLEFPARPNKSPINDGDWRDPPV